MSLAGYSSMESQRVGHNFFAFRDGSWNEIEKGVWMQRGIRMRMGVELKVGVKMNGE